MIVPSGHDLDLRRVVGADAFLLAEREHHGNSRVGAVSRINRAVLCWRLMDGEPTTSTLFESRVIDPKWMLESTGHRPSLAGGRYSFHDLRVRCKGMEIEALDDLPKKQGYRRPYYRDRKQLSDLLGPLKGYLYAQIGRRWDTVYSEIREQIDPNLVTQLHILGHVFGTPPRLIVGIPRTPVIPRGWVVRGRISPSRISCGRWGWWSIVIANIRWCWGGWGGACRETNQQSRDQDFFDHFPSSLFIAEGGRHR